MYSHAADKQTIYGCECNAMQWMNVLQKLTMLPCQILSLYLRFNGPIYGKVCEMETTWSLPHYVHTYESQLNN